MSFNTRNSGNPDTDCSEGEKRGDLNHRSDSRLRGLTSGECLV